MKIGIVLHPFGEKKPAGLGRYILDLTKSLIENDPENEYIVYLKEKPQERPTFAGSNWRVEVLGFGRLWRELGFFFAPKSDVYIFNTPIMPLFFRPKKSIVIALDYAYMVFKPKSAKERFRNWLVFMLNKLALKKATQIVSISEFTKKETMRIFGIKEEKIKVIYPGFWNAGQEPERESIIPLPKKFFLVVGVIKERKNLLNVVKGFAEFKKNKEGNCKLLVAGKKGGWYYEKVVDFVKKENLESEVVFLGFVSDEELFYIYKRAQALVFPSLVEGFGLPVLEAMSCEVPVITSNIGSLSEVARDAALLVDPVKPDDISKAMDKIFDNELLRQELIKKGNERTKDFSFKKGAKEFLNIVKEL